jgi:hypothetical protein
MNLLVVGIVAGDGSALTVSVTSLMRTHAWGESPTLVSWLVTSALGGS